MITSGVILTALVSGCGDKGAGVSVLDTTATVSDDIATVITVDWTTDVDAPGYVRYRTDEGSWQTPVDEGGTTHQAVLLGLPPDTDVELQVVARQDGVDVATGDLLRVTTGALPSDLPSMTVEGDGATQYMLTPLIGAVTGPVIIDPQGRVVWYHEDTRGLDIYRARLLPDGSGVIYAAASVSGDPAADSALVVVPWDGSSETTIPVPLLAHDFVFLPDGTITAIAVEYGEGPEGEVRGDRLVDIDPDGTLTDIWTSWDCFDPDEQPGDDPELGWTWVNALDYDEAEDAYYVGIRNFSSIMKLDRATGECGWIVGDEAATIEIEGQRFIHQHQFEIAGRRLLVFDNEGLGGTRSRVMEYDLDVDAGVATEVWSYEPDPSIYSFVLGDVHRYDDGDTLITWSVAGQIDRVTSAGAPNWTLNTELGYAFGFNSLYDDLYVGR